MLSSRYAGALSDSGGSVAGCRVRIGVFQHTCQGAPRTHQEGAADGLVVALDNGYAGVSEQPARNCF